MRYPLALGGLALGAVLAVTGCRAGRTPYDLSLVHHRTGAPAPAGPYRAVTPAPRAAAPVRPAPPAVRGAQPSRRDAWSRYIWRHGAWRPAPPAAHGLPSSGRDWWRPGRPVHTCATLSLGHGRGRSVQCVQRQDEVLTRSDSRVLRDDDSWPDTDQRGDDD